MAKVRVKEIDISFGLSVEVGGTWIRPNARMVVELDEDFTDREGVWNQAWNEVTKQIDKQIQDYIKSL